MASGAHRRSLGHKWQVGVVSYPKEEGQQDFAQEHECMCISKGGVLLRRKAQAQVRSRRQVREEAHGSNLEGSQVLQC